MTDAAMTTIDVAALNVLADWFNKLPDGGMGKEHFDGLVIVVSELLSRVPSEQPVPPAPARPANAELVERLCSSVQALIAALPPNPAEGLFLQAEATAEQCRRTLAALASSPAVVPSGHDLGALYNRITDLILVGNRLSFAAQTTGGTAGRDDDLVARIGEWQTEVEKAKAVQRIVKYEPSPSPPALDGAGRDAVLEEIAKQFDQKARTAAGDIFVTTTTRSEICRAVAAEIRSLKETR